MTDYGAKSYGRNEEVAFLFRRFHDHRDISMHGPRRLGKTFLLDRLVDAAPGRKWIAVKAEVAGCKDVRSAFGELCRRIGTRRSGGQQALDWLLQRLGQFFAPNENAKAWYEPFLALDHEAYFERLVKAMHEDKKHKWLLLIDELPILLKTLHDEGPIGIRAAWNFMNYLSRLRENYPRVRWMITGSIGIEPLARQGDYLGVLAKFENYELQPLTEAQSVAFVRDLASEGRIERRTSVSEAEAAALAVAVGWRAPYYLEALALKLEGTPTSDPARVSLQIEAAIEKLLLPSEGSRFGTWEEHLRKHYPDPERSIAFSALHGIAKGLPQVGLDDLHASIGRPEFSRDSLLRLMNRLDSEGFISVEGRGSDDPTYQFRSPLLRRWWARHRPSATP